MAPDREPRGDWHILALVGLAALLACGGLLWGLRPERPRPAVSAGYETQDPGYYPGGIACRPGEVARLPWRERLEQTERCQEAQEQHRLASNGLVQQRRAATAAEATADLAFSQTMIALWALVLTVFTLAAAVLAAMYARRAAVATKAAVFATREVADAQLRPWLTFSDVEIAAVDARALVSGAPVLFQVKGKISNSGSIAANHVSVRMFASTWSEVHEGYQRILGGEIIGPSVFVVGPMVLGPGSYESLMGFRIESIERRRSMR